MDELILIRSFNVLIYYGLFVLGFGILVRQWGLFYLAHRNDMKLKKDRLRGIRRKELEDQISVVLKGLTCLRPYDYKYSETSVIKFKIRLGLLDNFELSKVLDLLNEEYELRLRDAVKSDIAE